MTYYVKHVTVRGTDIVAQLNVDRRPGSIYVEYTLSDSDTENWASGSFTFEPGTAEDYIQDSQLADIAYILETTR